MGREVRTKLVGVTKENDHGNDIQDILEYISHDYVSGDPIELVREPDNPHDPNAIKAYYDGDHIGYIDMKAAEELSPLVADGRVAAELLLITGGRNGKYYGCNILIKVSDWGFPTSFQRVTPVNTGGEKLDNWKPHTYSEADRAGTSFKRSALRRLEPQEPTLFDHIIPPDSIREKALPFVASIVSFTVTISVLILLFA